MYEVDFEITYRLAETQTVTVHKVLAVPFVPFPGLSVGLFATSEAWSDTDMLTVELVAWQANTGRFHCELEAREWPRAGEWLRSAGFGLRVEWHPEPRARIEDDDVLVFLPGSGYAALTPAEFQFANSEFGDRLQKIA